MSMVINEFHGLYKCLLSINFFGAAGEAMPVGPQLVAAISEAGALLPRQYAETYVSPLQSNLPRLQELVASNRLPIFALETLTGVIYQHRSRGHVTAALERYLAVSSNLYRSFLAPEKRLQANIPVRSPIVPPLALFQREGRVGPFVLTEDEVYKLIGGEVGIASLPATYAEHPLIWAIVAHETGGHSVAEEDPGLLEQIAAGVHEALAGIPDIPGASREELAFLWKHWITEATADVFGLLNIGPAFAANIAAFFSAARAQGVMIPPKLRMRSSFASSDPKKILDSHPTDILRMHLALGVVDGLAGLAAQSRNSYATSIEKLAAVLADGDRIRIVGNIPLDLNHFRWLEVELPLTVLQDTARRIGQYVASTKLPVLNSHSIQEIETWDDSDES